MTAVREEPAPEEVEPLCITLEYQLLSTSALSSFLRTLQAALREVGRHLPQVGQAFQEKEGPRLVIRRIEGRESLECDLLFVASFSHNVLADVSHKVFESFMTLLIGTLRESSQRTLFGDRLRRPSRKHRALPPELLERIDQLEEELRRFPRQVIRYGGYRVEVKGDIVEIREPSRETA